MDTLGELVALLRTVALRVQLLAQAHRPGEPTHTVEEQIQQELHALIRALTARPWFAEFRTRLRTEFDSEPSAATVNRFITQLSQERSCTITEVETTPVAELLRALEHPSWNTTTLTLRFRDLEKKYRAQAKNQILLFEAFDQAGWPEEIEWSTSGTPLSTFVNDVNKSLGPEAPIRFRANGNGTGVILEIQPILSPS